MIDTPEAPPAEAPPVAPAALEPPPAAEIVTPPAAPAAPRAFNDDGTFTENWHQAFGDEFSAYGETAARFKNPGDLLKSYVHLRQTGPAYPDSTATPDQVERFRQLANVPATAEGYNLPVPENLPEGVSFNADLAADFAKLAHQHHVPAPALRALMDKQLAIASAEASEHAQAIAKAQEEARSSLITEWKGDYTSNLSTVRHLTERFGEAAGIEEGAVKELANNPAFARIMHQVAKLTREDSVAAPAGFGDLRSSAERADSIIAGKDAQWSERYANGDPAAYQLVTKLLGEAKK
jgi:hypothetical protein